MSRLLRFLALASLFVSTAAFAADPVIVNRVRFLPAPEREQAMLGGKIAGSNVSSSAGFKVLAEIKTTPKRGEWSEIKFENTTAFRWVRYEAPAGSHGNVAELEFYAGEKKPEGRGLRLRGRSVEGGARWEAGDVCELGEC